MKKGTFLLYDIDLESITYLNDMQIAKLFRAIIKYRLKGETTDFSDDAALKILFHQITEHISLNEEKYKTLCEKNSEIAKKRWAKQKASDNEDIPTHTSEYESIPKDTNLCLYDTDTVTDTGTVTGTDTHTVTDTVNVTHTDNDACGAKRENKRKNYYNKKNNVPELLRDNPSYDIDEFMRKSIERYRSIVDSANS